MTSETVCDAARAPCAVSAMASPQRYVDVEEIGDGAYGSVRQCWDRELRCTRAVKIFKDNEGADDVGEACLREIAFQSFLTDAGAPNVVPLLDILLGSEGQVSMLMPCLERDVGSAIDDAYFTSWDLCRPVLRDGFTALSYLHAFEPPLMHRDLKPENMLLDPTGRAYLTDFGFMRFVRDGLSALTREVACRGSNQRATQTYSAPEMLQEGKAHDERVDVWAMGVVVLELSRNARLDARTDKTARRYIKRQRDAVWSASAGEVERLLVTLLQEDPNKRATSRAALASDALRMPGSGMEECAPAQDASQTARAAALPPTVVAQERRPSGTAIPELIAKTMETLDYKMPQTFYAACAYVGDALESGQCDAPSAVLVLCAVATAAKLYEHEYWDAADLAKQTEVSVATLTAFQKRLMLHRRGRLLIPFPRTTASYEQHLPNALVARKSRRRRRRQAPPGPEQEASETRDAPSGAGPAVGAP